MPADRPGPAHDAGRPNGSETPIRKIILGAVTALFLVATCATASSHVRGCHSHRCNQTARRACAHDPSCVRRVTRKRWHRTADPYWGIFQAIAQCESGGRWHIATGNGFYGGIQFALRSWYGVGGHGSPAAASKLEQIYRGVLLKRAQGFGAWPVCRHAAGV